MFSSIYIARAKQCLIFATTNTYLENLEKVFIGTELEELRLLTSC